MVNRAIILLLSILFLACQHERKPAGVWISFDDRSVDAWYGLRDLFEKHDVIATFFITQPDSLSSSEIAKLKELQQDGHEIGFHGSMHVLSEHYIKEHGYDDYLDREIDRGVATMREMGFEVTSFAYPYGAKYWFTDFLLKRRFQLLRGVAALAEEKDLTTMDEIYYTFGGDRTLDAIGFDNNAGITHSMLAEAMTRAKENGELVMLYAHIPTDSREKGYYFDVETLEFIINQAKAHELVFYTGQSLR